MRAVSCYRKLASGNLAVGGAPKPVLRRGTISATMTDSLDRLVTANDAGPDDPFLGTVRGSQRDCDRMAILGSLNWWYIELVGWPNAGFMPLAYSRILQKQQIDIWGG